MLLTVRVDSYLRFDPNKIPESALASIQEALTSINPDNEDERISLFGGDSDGNFVAPRGFALKLRRGLSAAGIEVVWDDRRADVPVDFGVRMEGMQPRNYQLVGIERMASCEQGIYEAPPGSGKTISACFFMARAKQRTIILVDKVNIAQQWRDRIETALGIKTGLIGDDVWDEADVTVALRQTLWAKHQELDRSGWWDNWGAIILDECHAISAPTVRALIQRFPARYRIGLSATPDRHEWMTRVSRQVIGEIFRRTTDEELEVEGVLIRPSVVAVRTNFEFPWDRRKSPQAQWTKLTKAIKYDKGRNQIFANLVATQRGHTCLVHTDQKQHAHELASYALMSWPNDRVLMMTGDQNLQAREAVIARAAEGDVLIISTIGQEALDIPRLDRFFLVWPSKSVAMVKQMVGRVKRTHETKTERPIVFDFYDHRVVPLRKHFSDGRRVAYARDNLELKIVDG